MHENVHQRKNGLAVHTRSGLALGSRVPSRPSLGKGFLLCKDTDLCLTLPNGRMTHNLL